MKSCPSCNRTFEDTFTFCLIDGSVLSAPFEPTAGKSPKAAREPRTAKTEVLSAKTATLPPPVAEPANLKRDLSARDTDPSRAADTDSSLPSIPGRVPARGTEGPQSFATSPVTQWTYGLRGLIGVVLSLIYFLKGEPDPRNLMGSFGVFALAGGICILIAAGRTMTEKRRESLIMIEGVISVLLGLHLSLALFATPIEIGFWMLATGSFQLVTATRLRMRVSAWWLLGLAGVVSFIVGSIVLPYGITFGTGARFRGSLKLIDAYIFVAGLLSLLFAIKLRSKKQPALS